MKYSSSVLYAFFATLPGIIFSISQANAADLDPPAPAVPATIQTYDWTGPYFGLQVGGAIDGDASASGAPLNADGDLDGVLGGVFGGYNFHKGNIVFGLDTDFAFTDIDEDLGAGSVELDTLSTARVRVGYAYDRILPYVTGGLAYSFVDIDGGPGFGSEDEFFFGWTAGAGVEYAITDRINARIQYNYVDLGEEDVNFGGGNVSQVELDNLHIIRAGVSIKTDFIFDKIFRRK